jgi:type IV secretory pathway VirB10-like protein
MSSNRLAFAALGIACIAAAAGGGYLASRQNAVPAPVAASATPPPAAALTPEKPVQETEAVVAESAAQKPAEASAPIAAPPVSARTPAPRRAEPAPRAPSTRESRSTVARQEPAQPPSLSSSWPSSASAQPPAPAVPAASAEASPQAIRPAEAPPIQEAPRAPEPPQKTFEELVVSSDSVIGLQTENRITSETARVEDRVEARVTRDVKVGDRVAIPAGARALGTVTQVERGGKFKERARLGVRFHTLVLADGTRIPISTETIYRDGDSPANSSAAKIGGGAVGGAILGAILGGAKGAAIGASAGAGGGAATVMAGDRSAVVLAPGTPMTVRILSPVTVTIERE